MKSLETFYGECIESKIKYFELKAGKSEVRWPCMRQHAEMGLAQIVFFEDEKNRLIVEMLKEDLGKDLTKISRFLTKAFNDSFACQRALVHLPANGESKRFDGGRLAWKTGDVERIHEPACSSTEHVLPQGSAEILFEPTWSHGSLIDDED
jgi:hypothetical protein